MVLFNTKSKKTSGFTLVELLIVIVIIAILAAITIVAYNGITTRAKAAKYASEAQSIAKKMELYNTTVGKYPPAQLSSGYDDATITSRSLAGALVQATYMGGGEGGIAPKEAALPPSGGLGLFGILSPSASDPTYPQTLNGMNQPASTTGATQFAAGDYFFVKSCTAGGAKVFYPIPTNSTVGTITLGNCS